MRYDTVVIGAGMSGLAAGIRLAQFDRRVVVLERHAVWGGLNSFYTLGGRAFDVGLHALTNFVPPRTPGAPLTKLLRQLRIKHEELKLGEQRGSDLIVGGARLRFTNDFTVLESEVARAFPRAIDGFRRVAALAREHVLTEEDVDVRPSRPILTELVGEPLLVELLLLPVLYYGSAREDDCDWNLFLILFRSLFLEGLSRPEGGIRPVLNLLIKRYKSLGGELRLSAGVRRIVTRSGRAVGVVLDDGAELECDQILSSAGWVETMAMLDDAETSGCVAERERGRLSFLESISVLDRRPAELGMDCATSFFSLDERVRYHEPEGDIDPRSGVLSCPDNFAAERPPKEGMVRLTVLASHARWRRLLDEEGPERYAEAKARAADEAIGAACAVFPDWRPHTVFRDVFTPTTVERYTGRRRGAVYGSPAKRWNGETPVAGLALCGTDQGYLGVVGAMLSGVAMANRHALVPAEGRP